MFLIHCRVLEEQVILIALHGIFSDRCNISPMNNQTLGTPGHVPRITPYPVVPQRLLGCVRNLDISTIVGQRDVHPGTGKLVFWLK